MDLALSMDTGVDVFVKATVDIGEEMMVLIDCVLDAVVVEAVLLGRGSDNVVLVKAVLFTSRGIDESAE